MGARLLVLAPAACELGRAVRPLVELDDSIHRPVEEVAVVRDDHERSGQRVDEALEPIEPREVEIVRRLVEQEHVEAGEQDRRKLCTRRFAAGERIERSVERLRSADLRADARGARVEVGTA